MKVVHKIPLQVGTRVSVSLPLGTKLVHCDNQFGQPMLWVEKPQGPQPVEMRHFEVFGTGWDIPDDARHLGTVIQGKWVWHCYEVKHTV